MHKLKADLTEKRPLGEGPKKKYPAFHFVGVFMIRDSTSVLTTSLSLSRFH